MSGYSDVMADANEVNVVPVVETVPGDLLTPLGIYLRLSENTAHSFLLESVEGGKSLARYSFIGADPEFVWSGGDESVRASRAADEGTPSAGAIDFLREYFSKCKIAPDPNLPSFIGGAIGYLGFASSEWFEPRLKSGTPPQAETAKLMFFRSIVAFDHAQQVVNIISLVFAHPNLTNNDLDQRFDAARSQNARIKETLQIASPEPAKSSISGSASPASSNWSRADFESAVSRVKELINAG
jgi:anthranilate synthase component I